jgi:cytochrome b561
MRLVHWGTLLTVVTATALALARDWVSDELADTLLGWHRQAGLLILTLTLARLVIRPMISAPDHGAPPLQRKISTATHHLMYVFLLGLPALGWLASNADGVLLVMGPMTLPTLIDTDHELAETLGQLHEWGAWAFLSLVGLHALAALWHHFSLRDGVLSSMLGRSHPTH